MEKGKRKYFIIGGAVILIMLISGYGLVSAWGPCVRSGSGTDQGYRAGRFHPGFHRKDFAEFLLWKMDRRVEELGLSEAQEEKYNEIRSNLEKHLSGATEARKIMMDEFQREIEKENPDMRLLSDAVKDKMRKFTKFMEENLDLFTEFYESLDNSQRDKILEGIRERLEFHHT